MHFAEVVWTSSKFIPEVSKIHNTVECEQLASWNTNDPKVVHRWPAKQTRTSLRMLEKAECNRTTFAHLIDTVSPLNCLTLCQCCEVQIFTEPGDKINDILLNQRPLSATDYSSKAMLWFIELVKQWRSLIMKPPTIPLLLAPCFPDLNQSTMSVQACYRNAPSNNWTLVSLWPRYQWPSHSAVVSITTLMSINCDINHCEVTKADISIPNSCQSKPFGKFQ